MAIRRQNFQQHFRGAACRRPGYYVPFFSLYTIFQARFYINVAFLKYVSGLYKLNYCSYACLYEESFTKFFYTVCIISNECIAILKINNNKYSFIQYEPSKRNVKIGEEYLWNSEFQERRIWTFSSSCCVWKYYCCF